ncbi:hydrogenase [Rhodopseudomonas palustris]|uniref:nickel-dependent hydrogenase large subunit n=1 Tax=Rhodopseudomonas palustris TaxID=1076 RepID=UPI00115DE71F|nr:nickel-dependent hydrogenase large subunit [Rhodopseudomonas palustris]QDL99499.1 hydrogenase [Rhodopseudomonas palustris]
MTAAPGEDRIEVGIVRRGDRVVRLDITARRPIGIGRLAQGKSGETVVALVPRLFALCASAQGVAAAQALAAARGISPSPAIVAAQASAVLAERMIELLRGTVLLLGGGGSLSLTHHLRDLTIAARPRDPAAPLDDDAISRIAQGLEALGLAPRSFADAGACRRWLGSDALLARLHRPLLAAAEFGMAVIDPLTAADDAAIGERLIALGPSFAVRPDLAGRVPETGAVARNADHPVIASFGGGLGGRLLARLIEIAATPELLRAVRRGNVDTATVVQSAPLGAGIGLAAVESARGRLHHLIALDAGGAIRQFDILAPTEWNFHPEGPLARGLVGTNLRATEPDRQRVAALVAAFDPCVGYDVRFREAADA